MTSTAIVPDHPPRRFDSLNKLRTARPHSPHLAVDSTRLKPSSLPYNSGGTPRDYHLSLPSSSHPGPIIAASPWMPSPLVPHLMRNKRDSAIATKYLPGTAITNMEAMLHTFVTAILPIEMYGDYRYDSMGIGHDVPFFEPIRSQAPGPARLGRPTRPTRMVLLSTQVHLDFETSDVGLEFFALPQGDSAALLGQPLHTDWDVLSSGEKANDSLRSPYDKSLRRHAIHHLVKSGKLMSDCEETWRSVGRPWSVTETISNVEDILRSPTALLPSLIDQHVVVLDSNSRLSSCLGARILSLELLLNTYISTLVNELSVLEAFAPSYVYTYDPPSIFARQLGLPDGPRLLNLVWALALMHVVVRNREEEPGLKGLKVLAFNDYAHLGIVEMLDQAIRTRLRDQATPKVISRSQLFGSKDGRLDTHLLARLVPELGRDRGLALFIHNNSDAFGQNIETESRGGSLDGAIGERSSAAAGLRRDREDLVDFVI